MARNIKRYRRERERQDMAQRAVKKTRNQWVYIVLYICIYICHEMFMAFLLFGQNIYIYIHVYSRTEMPIYSENLRIPCFHMFSSYSRPELRYITFIGISAKFECKSWVMENPMPHECEFLRVVKTKNKKTTGVGLALGLELLVVALKVLKDISPYSVFIPATHTQKSSHRTKSSHSTDVIALHSG